MKHKLATMLATLSFGATAALAHSDAIKPEYVDKLLEPYFALQTALSKDNLDAASKSAADLQTLLGEGPSHEAAPELADLSDEAQTIASAPGIAEARAAFQTLSDDIAKMIEHVGVTGEQDVYKIFCPMAFNNKGAAWLQGSPSVANPYFGAKMYKCGIEQGKLGKGKSDKKLDSTSSKAGDGHGAHAH